MGSMNCTSGERRAQRAERPGTGTRPGRSGRASRRNQAVLDRELLEPVLGALESLAEGRRAGVEVVGTAEDAGDVFPGEAAIEAKQKELVLLGVELIAQHAELVLDLGALDVEGDGADDGGDVGGEREREVAVDAAARVAAELGERVARELVQP